MNAAKNFPGAAGFEFRGHRRARLVPRSHDPEPNVRPPNRIGAQFRTHEPNQKKTL